MFQFLLHSSFRVGEAIGKQAEAADRCVRTPEKATTLRALVGSGETTETTHRDRGCRGWSLVCFLWKQRVSILLVAYPEATLATRTSSKRSWKELIQSFHDSRCWQGVFDAEKHRKRQADNPLLLRQEKMSRLGCLEWLRHCAIWQAPETWSLHVIIVRWCEVWNDRRLRRRG